MGSDTTIIRGAAATVREGFGETTIERRAETGSTALAAKAQAEVNARYVMALQRPRDLDVVRAKLLRECDRPSFAERAFYSLPRGDRPGRLTGRANCIEGLSVRFAESAIRLAGNLWQQTSTIYDDDFKRMIRVSVVDLETNAGYDRELVVDKTIERKKPKPGAVILGKRTNSSGDEVFVVQATEEELLQKEASLISRTFRTLGLRFIPPDILEECEQRVVRTWKNQDAKDPEGSRKRLLDSFAALGVPVVELKEYLGHAGDRLTPDERLELGALHNAIRDHEITWAQALGERRAQRAPAGEGAAPAAATNVAQRVQERAAAIKAAGEAKRRAAGAAPPAPAPGQPASGTMPARPAVDPDADSPPPDDVITVGDSREREPGEEG